MKFHPYSEIFPLIEGAEFEALVADIKTHGLREKIWQYEGKILDGRNRFLACQKAKVKPLYRKFTGNDALAFVVSLNVQRRHMNASQVSMAAARIATLKRGGNQHSEGVSIETSSEMVGASVGSAKRARQVVDKGSVALQRAVDSGEVPVSRAAAVVDLPKSEQLKAATQKAPEEPERPEDDPDEDVKLAAIEKEYAASIDKVMEASDKLSAAHAEIKRQAAEIATLKLSRDGFMNGKAAMTKLLKSALNKVERLERDNKKLSERVALMEAA